MKWRALVAVVLVSTHVAAKPPPESEPETGAEAGVVEGASKRVLPSDIKLNPPLQTLPSGEDKIVPLNLGAPAPFAGQLFDTNTAIRWGMWLQQWKLRYKADMALQLNTCAAEADFQETVAAIEQERLLTVSADLEDRLRKSETARLAAEARVRDPGFWSSNGFYFGLGVAATGAAVGLTAWALNSSK